MKKSKRRTEFKRWKLCKAGCGYEVKDDNPNYPYCCRECRNKAMIKEKRA